MIDIVGQETVEILESMFATPFSIWQTFRPYIDKGYAAVLSLPNKKVLKYCDNKAEWRNANKLLETPLEYLYTPLAAFEINKKRFILMPKYKHLSDIERKRLWSVIEDVDRSTPKSLLKRVRNKSLWQTLTQFNIPQIIEDTVTLGMKYVDLHEYNVVKHKDRYLFIDLEEF